jgi:rod shape-determining protein MreB
MVVYKSVRVGGTRIDEAIVQHLKRKYNLIVGERTAEDIKIKIGNAYLEDASEEKKIEVRGRDFQSGLPKIVEISELAISEAIQKPLKGILEGVKEVLSQTPPELASDIVDKGIVLSGGTSMLKNLDKYFSYSINVASFIAEEPLFCVIRGVGMAIDNLENFKDAIR